MTLLCVRALDVQLLGLHVAVLGLGQGVRIGREQNGVFGDVEVNLSAVAPSLVLDIGFGVLNGLLDVRGSAGEVALFVRVVGGDHLLLAKALERQSH